MATRQIGAHSTLQTVEFNCGHRAEFLEPPFKGVECYCPRCRNYKTVVKAPPVVRLRCFTCRYSRRYGAARLEAQLAADRHTTERAGHLVTVYDGREVLSEHGRGESQTELEF